MTYGTPGRGAGEALERKPYATTFSPPIAVVMVYWTTMTITINQ